MNTRGRSKYSDEEARKWLADYQRLKSLMKAAKANGVNFMTLYQTLLRRGLIQKKPRRLPEEVVDAIASDYRRLRSVEKVADRCGRTRQSVWNILHRRGLTLPPRPRKTKVIYKGEAFTVGKNGYLRSTRAETRKRGGSRLLHRVKWEEAYGPIPPGHVLVFKDENRENCALDNLEMMTHAEARKRMTLNGKNANAWSVFRDVHNHLLRELQSAEASGDSKAIAKARKAYEGLKPPARWTPEARAKFSQLLRDRWAKIPKEQRTKQALKGGATRRRNRHAKRGTALERMVA